MDAGTLIADLVVTETGLLNPLHAVADREKVSRLAADMKVRGWCGAPLVADGENAYTGVHRIAAVARLWNEMGVDVQIPRVDIRELCARFDLDWDAMLDEHAGDGYRAAATLRSRLPREVVDYLGVDVDGAL